MVFYGDSTCYPQASSKRNAVRSYQSDLDWVLHGYEIGIGYKGGGEVEDIVDMTLNGPSCDTIVVPILGNDFICWNKATKSDDVVPT